MYCARPFLGISISVFINGQTVLLFTEHICTFFHYGTVRLIRDILFYFSKHSIPSNTVGDFWNEWKKMDKDRNGNISPDEFDKDIA